MRRRLRQAGRAIGHTTHHFARLIGTILLLLLLGFGAAAWRLSRGPVAVPFLTARISEAASAALPDMQVSIGGAALAWEGFHRGGAPLDLRLDDIVIYAPDGAIDGTISQLRVTLSVLKLVRGRIAPILVLARDSAIQLQPGTVPVHQAPNPVSAAAAFARVITGTPGKNALDFTNLREIRVIGARIALIDPANRIDLMARGATLAVRRAPDGSISGVADALLRHGEATAALHFQIGASHGKGLVTAKLGPFDPALIAPENAQLRRLDLPVTLAATWPIGADRAARAIDVAATLGAGSADIEGSRIPISAGRFKLSIDPSGARLTHARIDLAPREGAAPHLTATGAIGFEAPYAGSLHFAIDRVTAASLPVYWPRDFVDDTRRFVIERITDGVATNGDFTARFHLAAPAALTGIHGGFAASGVTLDWLPGAAKMTGLGGTLDFPNADMLTITATQGALGGMALHGAMTINGLNTHHQDADITAHLTGPMTGAVPALNAPPLRLAAQGFDLTHATGDLEATITARVPLVKDLKLDQVTLGVDAGLADGTLPLPIVGLALDRTKLRLKADLHDLDLSGTGTLGDAPASFKAEMKLPDGPLILSGKSILDSALLQQLGAPRMLWQSGSAPLDMTYRAAKGTGQVSLAANLADVSLELPQFGWHKPKGVDGTLDLKLGLASGKPTGLESITAMMPDFMLSATKNGGQFMIATARIGRTSASGTLTPPAAAGAPWMATVHGDLLDLASEIRPADDNSEGQETASAPPSEDGHAPAKVGPAGPNWHLDADFAHLALDDGTDAKPLGATTISADGAGTRVDRLNAVSRSGGNTKATLRLTRAADLLNVDLVSGNASALLAAMGETDIITGGTLRFAGSNTEAGIEGRLTIQNFRVPQAPAVAKLLQALTIYGMPAAASGPGLGFSELVADLKLKDSRLSILRGHADSPSLGLTAAGSVDLAGRRYDVGGTIVPAYALNSLPGKIPVIGQLFRSEKAGGLFAARYTLTGPFASPDVEINPLAAFTPGILRDLFGPAEPAPSPSVNGNKHP